MRQIKEKNIYKELANPLGPTQLFVHDFDESNIAKEVRILAGKI